MVSIIILSYNTQELLKSCLQSIFDNLSKLEIEVIVSDNDSKDKSVAMVKKEFPQVKIIENNENLGFSKGNNIGAKAARGEFLLFLNSDTRFTDDSLTKIISILQKDDRIAVVGGLMVNKDGTKHRSFGRFYTLFRVALMLFGGEQLENSKTEEASLVDWVSGGFMLIKSDIFSKVGGFDEKMFMYVEDMELCFRIKKLGFKVYFDSESQVFHVGQGSSNKSFAIVQIYKGILYFYKKHKTSLEYDIVKILLMGKALIAFAIGIISNNVYLKETYKKALRVTL